VCEGLHCSPGCTRGLEHSAGNCLRHIRVLRHYAIPMLEKSTLADLIFRRQHLTLTSAATMLAQYRLTASEGTYGESGGPDLSMQVYAKETFVSRYRKDLGGVVRLAVSHDGKVGVSSCYGSVKVWDLATGRTTQTIRRSDRIYTAIAITPNNLLILAAFDMTIAIFDLTTGRETMILTGHSGNVYDLDVSPDGRTAISVSQDCTLKIWRLATGELMATFTADAPLYCCRVASDGACIFSIKCCSHRVCYAVYAGISLLLAIAQSTTSSSRASLSLIANQSWLCRHGRPEVHVR